MSRAALFILIVILFAGTLISTAPLGLFLGQLGLSSYGIGWGQAQGTVWNGRVNGVFTTQQAIGDVKLAFRPTALLSGGLGYHLDVGGAGVRGTGRALFRPGLVEFDQLRVRQKIGALEGLDLPVRAVGGEIRIIDGSLVLDRDGCRRVDGQVTSDLLTRAAAQYGKVFGPISGQLSCDGGLIRASLESTSPAGDSASFDIAFGISGEVSLKVEVVANDPELAVLMSRSGFTPREDRWVYSFASTGAGQ